MQEKADAFLVMPGGLGTLEEAFDTWNTIKIGLLNKPIGFLNTNGYFDGLLSFISHAASQGFVSEKQANIPLVSASPEILVAELGRAIRNFHKF